MSQPLVDAVSKALHEHDTPLHSSGYPWPLDEFDCCAEEALNTLVTKLSETDDLKHAVSSCLYQLHGSLHPYSVTEIADTAVYAVLTYLRAPEAFDVEH